MNSKYEDLINRVKDLQEKLKNTDTVILEQMDEVFMVDYTHNSTAIEGNTLTLLETKVVLEDKLSVPGKLLREIYEVNNHRIAYEYVQRMVREGKSLTEPMVKDIHEKLMQNIFQGGFYRDVNVRISGARHYPPEPEKMFVDMQNFFADIPWKEDFLDSITFAAWTHAEFVRIHPFVDGNGRTSRLLMNFVLLRCGLLPVSVPNASKLEYYETLEKYALEGDLEPFADFVANLEQGRAEEVLKFIG